jgi:hypothetical protein
MIVMTNHMMDEIINHLHELGKTASDAELVHIGKIWNVLYFREEIK